jgi:hypothetical protein
MTNCRVVRRFPYAAVVAALMCVYASSQAAPATSKPATSPKEDPAVTEFNARIKEYMALHVKLEAKLPNLPKKASPQALEKNQRALAALIKAARSNAKPGDIFNPGIQTIVKQVIAEVLAGPDGKTVKSSIMDENPGVTKVVLNERYPTTIPLSTMPPQMLTPLPKLEGELEYRFLGRRLILLDTEADIILDYIDDAMAN